jgi:hypothetical protein
LLGHQQLWSDVMTDVFINALAYSNVLESNTPGLMLGKVLDQSGFYIPLKEFYRLLNLLWTGGGEWRDYAHRLNDIYELRQEMVEAIYETAEEPL